MTPPMDRERLAAFVDGALAPEDAATVVMHLADHPQDQAPHLPHGYPVMTFAAMVPPLWRRMMNPRVRAWRRRHYPDITDWMPYNRALNPLPRAAGVRAGVQTTS
jgi:anti-sigma factor RsiW